ncbi:MAG: GNAT family N-acetyltransferase [Candidatus Sericytochromatia bacterium]|nr:GNAT family N-acetyltransferase [Candidatus Sericytochromatia bacterium]
MPAAIAVRAAIPADVPQILLLIQDLAAYEELSHECLATAEALQLHLFGPKPVAEVLLAQVGGETAGFALFFTSFSTFLASPCLYLEDLFVRPDWRKHGVGRALLQGLAKVGAERQAGRIEWHVLTWNKLARDFYDRQGAGELEGFLVYRLDKSGMQMLAEAAD